MYSWYFNPMKGGRALVCQAFATIVNTLKETKFWIRQVYFANDFAFDCILTRDNSTSEYQLDSYIILFQNQVPKVIASTRRFFALTERPPYTEVATESPEHALVLALSLLSEDGPVIEDPRTISESS